MTRRRALTLIFALALLATVLVGRSLAGKTTHTVTITSGPSGTVASTDADFAFVSSASSTFTCSLDGAAASGCGFGLRGSVSYHGLSLGTHRFSVLATVPRSQHTARDDRSWTVIQPPAQNKPPSASFTYSPSAPKAGEQVTFTSTSTDSDGRIVNYEWDTDGDGVFGETGEPVGVNATSATHSFPGAGSYTVQLRVTDDDGAQAVASQIVIVGSPPAPTGPRRVPVRFEKDRLHGPYSLSAATLERLLGSKRPSLRGSGPPEQDSDLVGVPISVPPCAQRLCSPPISLGLQKRALPPPPKPFTCCTGGSDFWIDPQIAASNSYLVIGMHHKVLFYDKAGKQLYTKAAQFSSRQPAGTDAAAIGNKSYPYTIQLCDLFKPLIPYMNNALHLPIDLTDVDDNAITVKNGYGLNCNAATGGIKPTKWTAPIHKNKVDNFYWPYDTFFDARVVWDEYHKRFWIAALAQNKNSLHRGELGPAEQGTYDVARSRRAMLAIAVSKTQDPRDGWNEYWAWSYPGQDSCPQNTCPYYGRGDFLWAGITSKYLVLESNVSDANKPGKPFSALPELTTGEDRFEIIALPTDPVVNLADLPPLYSNLDPLTNPDGSTATHPWPAIQHAPDVPGNVAFLASQYRAGDSYQVLLWVLAIGSGGGVMYQQPVPVSQYVAINPNDVPMPSGATSRLFGDGITKLVYRNGSLYLTFAECGDWVLGCLDSVLRFVRIQVKGIVKTQGEVTQLFVEKAVDLKFAGPAVSDPPNKKAWYGFPGVEANKKGDAVVVYQRSGSFVNPEVRYSPYLFKETNIRASRLIMAGDSSLGQCSAGNCTHHYMGMSVDPWDDTGVWVIHGFARGGGWGYVVAKVLAPGHPDLTLAGAKALPGAPGKVSSRRIYTLKLRVVNQGDGAAAASFARVYLGGKLVGSVRIGRLARSGSKNISLELRFPSATLGSRDLRVSLDASKKLKEYDEQNNTVFVPLP